MQFFFSRRALDTLQSPRLSLRVRRPLSLLSTTVVNFPQSLAIDTPASAQQVNDSGMSVDFWDWMTLADSNCSFRNADSGVESPRVVPH